MLFYHDFLTDDNLYFRVESYSSPSVEPEGIICGENSCQDQYLSKITAKGKPSFKRLIADDIQLVQKFETLWGAEYAPKNDIIHHR